MMPSAEYYEDDPKVAWKAMVAIVVFVVACGVLGGCASTKTPPAPAIVAVPPAKPYVPAECDERKDPRWAKLPDADVRRSDGARAWRRNKEAFASMRRSRSVCGSALRAGRGE